MALNKKLRPVVCQNWDARCNLTSWMSGSSYLMLELPKTSKTITVDDAPVRCIIKLEEGWLLLSEWEFKIDILNVAVYNFFPKCIQKFAV